MNNSPIKLEDCWAKTDVTSGKPAMTVRDHCLIVGTVADIAGQLLSPACRKLLPVGATTFTAAHDIGKITPGFQQKCLLSRFSSIVGNQNCEKNHALVSQAFLASLPEMQDHKKRPFVWGLSAGGHHGCYPRPTVHEILGTKSCWENGLLWPDLLRRELLAELKGYFGALPSEEILIGARVHWLTGFVTFCDWIGSSMNWFPLHPEQPLRDHYTQELAQERAMHALNIIGWHRRAVAPSLTFSQLFVKKEAPRIAPRALQESLIALADQQGLYIVEAPMGLGKTEAALAAAYRRWTEGDERGLYFALPTQLTSNRIHHRVSEFLSNVIDDETTQILAHGNAWLREDRVLKFSPSATSANEPDAREACQWFTSSRKPLLAPFGTGTIDQALMASICAKHSGLRLFALSGKVIVIDEVHSYDPYTSALVDQLVCWLLEVGCTVIVLSATLTAQRRNEMIEKMGATEPSPAPTSYPLISKVVGGRATHHPIIDPELTENTIHLKHLNAADSSFCEEAARFAEMGACVLVVRNTVALAQETYKAIKAALRDDSIPVGLLHSRFPHFQRESKEKYWMECLGKDTSHRPAGCVLVATQVVEQSVDIDADLLVTDLAPTDLLLQRLGRLHRHPRPRPTGFKNATCWILQPVVDWSDDPKIICKKIGASAFIYPPIAMYYSQENWHNRKKITLPNDIRELLETPLTLKDSLPSGAQKLAENLANETECMREKAKRQGPFQDALQDTEGAQTRYNMQPSAMLILLNELPRPHGNELTIKPLYGEPQTLTLGRFDIRIAKLLHENSVRIPAWLVRSVFGKQPTWLDEHISDAVIALCSDISTALKVIGGEDFSHQLHYHPERGIHYEKITAQPTSSINPNDLDSWF